VDWLPVADLVKLLQVVFVNLVLSADNAIVVAIAAAGLPQHQRPRVMAIGIGGATVLRIVFALFTVQLFDVTGLKLVGGLVLLWICWKLWSELRSGEISEEAAAHHHPKTMMAAVWQIIVADVSMSLDNVLAVAAAAGESTWVLVAGLVLSIAFMAVAATLISRMLDRYVWIGYVGLVVIIYVALHLTWEGALEVLPLVRAV
jgi:YjbE family integral membrane protein